MKVRSKLYKRKIKAKNTPQNQFQETKYRKYRKKLVDRFRLSKKFYYQDFFEKNIKKSKAS